MPSKKYYLDENRQEELELDWGFLWNNFSVSYNGLPVGKFESAKELRVGNTFLLPDKREVFVQLKRKWLYIQELEVLINGKPVPGSATDGKEQLKIVFFLMLFISVVNIGLSVYNFFSSMENAESLGIGIGTLLLGIIFLVLGLLVYLKKSLVSLYIAIGLLVLDSVLTIVMIGQDANTPPAGILMRIVILIRLIHGVSVLKKIKTEEKSMDILHQIDEIK